MSEHDHTYKIIEKGYRDGVYGQIITIVDTDKNTREETFTPLEVKNEYRPKNINAEKIAEEIKAKGKGQNPKVS